MPLMVIVSTAEPEFDPVRVTVIVVVVTAIVAEVMSPPPPVTLPVADLKVHPLGAVKISVPVPISPLPLPASAMTIFPRIVYCGDVAFAALSADIVPPVAAVTVTASVNAVCAVQPDVPPVAARI